MKLIKTNPVALAADFAEAKPAVAVDVHAVRSALFAYELLQQQMRRLREQHAGVFEQMDTLLAEAETAKDAVRRLVHQESKAPPDDMSDDATYQVWATSQAFGVKTQYRRSASYYDPRKIPPVFFASHPQIVTAVDTKLTASLAKSNNRLVSAFTPGEWQTPAIAVFALKNPEPEK